MTNAAKTLASLVGGIMSAMGTIFAMNAVVAWLDDAIVYVVNNGNLYLLASTMGMALGTIIAVLPWANLPDAPRLARWIVFLPGAFAVLMGLYLLGQIAATGLAEPYSFSLIEGWRVLAMTAMVTVLGGWAAYVAFTKPTSTGTA